MRRIGKAQSEEETDIDITPMLDVVFIMLIFFIVTASFIKESGFGLYNPPSSDTPPDPDSAKPIIVKVTKAGEIKINDRLVSAASVKANITTLKAENPDSTVSVKIDKKAKTGVFMKAVDGIRQAGVDLPSVSITDL